MSNTKNKECRRRNCIMAKVYSVDEALELIKSEGKMNRFNKKKFESVMIALANDPKFKEEVAKKVGDEVVVGEIIPSKSFRKWLKRIVEKAGVDEKESEKVLDPSFTITSVDGLYEFFTTAVYEYMAAGNRFDFPSHEDFQGSLYLKDVPESSTVYTARNPRTGESLGEFETHKKAHKVLAAKSSCPAWLASRKKK